MNRTCNHYELGEDIGHSVSGLSSPRILRTGIRGLKTASESGDGYQLLRSQIWRRMPAGNR
jgi:hypothetical protein